MKQLVTIHSGDAIVKYGYETSQLARQRIADYLGWDYLHALTSPQLVDDFRTAYSALGFHKSSVFSISNYCSDIGHDELSVPATIGFEGDVVSVNGFVVSVTKDNVRWYYSSGPFLKENLETGVLEWFHGDGSFVMKARMFDPRMEPTPVELHEKDYLYYKNGKWLTKEDLLIDFLLKETAVEDVIIRDQHQYIHPKLWRFVEVTGRSYYEIIHHNILLDPVANLRPKTNYLVASEPLSAIMQLYGYKAQFMPPIVLPDVETPRKVHSEIRNYCFVGNMSTNKHPEMVIEAFSKLWRRGVKASVTLFGGTDDKVEALKKLPNLTPNVTIAGFVDKVPFGEFDGYISCSSTELFANACVEAMAYGLKPLLSDVDFAHRYYASQAKDVDLFRDVDGLVNLVEKYVNPDGPVSTISTVDFVQGYALEKIAPLFKQLSLRGGDA